MYAQIEKPKGNQSRAVANSVAQKKGRENTVTTDRLEGRAVAQKRRSGGTSMAFVDNRDVTESQRILQLQVAPKTYNRLLNIGSSDSPLDHRGLPKRLDGKENDDNHTNLCVQRNAKLAREHGPNAVEAVRGNFWTHLITDVKAREDHSDERGKALHTYIEMSAAQLRDEITSWLEDRPDEYKLRDYEGMTTIYCYDYVTYFDGKMEYGAEGRRHRLGLSPNLNGHYGAHHYGGPV